MSLSCSINLNLNETWRWVMDTASCVSVQATRANALGSGLHQNWKLAETQKVRPAAAVPLTDEDVRK